MTPLLLALLFQDVEPATEPEPPPPPIVQQPTEPPQQGRARPPEIEEEPPHMSEGRMLVSAYNSGFQWGISPGVVFVGGEAGFALGLHFGYGVDAGPVIVVPGVRLQAYFTDPGVYVGMPDFKLVIPIDRFAPFVEGGVGIGYVTEDPSKTGVALMGGGGFMVHFRHIAIGAEAAYQTVTGTRFHGISVGPILAIGF